MRPRTLLFPSKKPPLPQRLFPDMTLRLLPRVCIVVANASHSQSRSLTISVLGSDACNVSPLCRSTPHPSHLQVCHGRSANTWSPWSTTRSVTWGAGGRDDIPAKYRRFSWNKMIRGENNNAHDRPTTQEAKPGGKKINTRPWCAHESSTSCTKQLSSSSQKNTQKIKKRI